MFRIGATLCLAMLVASCSRNSYEERNFQDARKDRSVRDLTRFVAESSDTGGAEDYVGQARLLIDKHYDYALRRLAETPDIEFRRALLGHLRKVQDPRIAVTVAKPEIPDSVASSPAMQYFSGSHYYEGDFASAATEASRKHFPYETLVFEVSGFDFNPHPTDVSVEVQWVVRPSGVIFNAGTNWADPMGEQEIIEGIEADVTMRFSIPGSEPFEFSASASPTDFSYEAFLGMPTASDLYQGMTKGIFTMAAAQIWPQASKTD